MANGLTDYQEQINDAIQEINRLLDKPILDDDGYPTETALEAVEKWHWIDAQGWFDFIQSIWYGRWKVKEEQHEIFKDRQVTRFYVSTDGWSGNESIIRAMEKNGMMWSLNWVQSRRGGHYIFELREF